METLEKGVKYVQRWGSSCKNGGVIHIGGVSIEGRGVSSVFLSLMYGFCSNNPLYSASLLLTVFVFLLTSFCFSFNFFSSNQSQPGVAMSLFFVYELGDLLRKIEQIFNFFLLLLLILKKQLFEKGKVFTKITEQEDYYRIFDL